MSSIAEPSESQPGAAQPEPVSEHAGGGGAPDPDSKDIEEDEPIKVSRTTDASLAEDSATTQSNQQQQEQKGEELTDAEASKSDHNPIQSADPRTHESESQEDEEEPKNSKLRKEEGSRTFTMRELLNDLKNGEANHADSEEADHTEAAAPHRLLHIS